MLLTNLFAQSLFSLYLEANCCGCSSLQGWLRRLLSWRLERNNHWWEEGQWHAVTVPGKQRFDPPALCLSHLPTPHPGCFTLSYKLINSVIASWWDEGTRTFCEKQKRNP